VKEKRKKMRSCVSYIAKVRFILMLNKQDE
jgi:hypothetical protein